MLVSSNGSSLFSPARPPPPRPHGRVRTGRWSPPSAKKPDAAETPRSKAPAPFFPPGPSKSLLARAAVAVFGLGFVDAGYSGDWSRIGVVTKETEELLKAAAYVVVPLCLFLVYSISGEEQGS